MKSLLIAAALILAPAAAQAQVAAGALPNTFDRPAVAALGSADTTRENALSERALRTLIAGAQVGTLDYTLMTDDLAGKVRAQETAIIPLLQGFGALQRIEFVGRQDGADLFGVVFANAATQWVIGFNEDGKVAALLFRPAE